MKWEKNSDVKDVVYSINELDGVFYVGLTRIPNKENDFLSKITGRIGRELQVFVNGKPYYGSVIARCLSFDVATNFVLNFEKNITEYKDSDTEVKENDNKKA